MALVSGSLWLSACNADRYQPKIADQIAEVPSTVYPKGTVGGDASDYTLAMPSVRNWFLAMREIERRARTDPSLQIAINYPFGSATASHVTDIEKNPAFVAALHSCQLTPREFVILTALVGSTLVALDQLGPENAHTRLKLDTGLANFARANRNELDSLRSTLR